MKLLNLQIKNYRNLKDVNIDFKNMNVLIGKNDSGKSNVLHAIELFFNWGNSKDVEDNTNLSEQLTRDLYEDMINFKDYRLFFDKNKKIELTGILELTNEELLTILSPEIKFKGYPSRFIHEFGNKIILSEEIEIIEEKSKRAILKINSIKLGNELILYQRHKGLSNFEDVKKQLIKKGEEYRIEELSNKERSVYPGVGVDFLNMLRKKFVLIPAFRKIEEEQLLGNSPSTDGKNVPNALFRMSTDASLNKENISEKIKDAIKYIFPKYEYVTSKSFGDSKRDIYFDSHPTSHVGTGILNWTDIIFHIFSEEDKIFGIEEPEIHLHADAQRKIYSYLEMVFLKRQGILTTHSTIFTSHHPEINLYLITNENKEAKIKLIKNENEFGSIKLELGIKNTDIFSHDSVWLVEGESEEIFFNTLADKNMVFRETGIKIINVTGKDSVQKKKIKEFLQYLKESGIKIFVILDKDERVETYISELQRERLLEESNSHIWSKGDFEDCFGERHIIEAMNKLLDGGFTLTDAEIKQAREEGKRTTDILNEFLISKKLGSLDKPALAEELAGVVNKEEDVEPIQVLKKFLSLSGHPIL